ncbi:hypothetical protein QBC38DRAFT_440843 [Podospora fimiseda]|uniref:Uncharacterized protein n=1 Tax=Podospora fimiseda TaxID=252190 RepID=A0AAN7H473_9PEZI|nr:hypothetical protein QBC38DRAFT_440843 [Podospora fimiseda]
MAPATDPSNNSNNNDNTSSSSTTQDGNDLPSSASVGDNLAQLANFCASAYLHYTSFSFIGNEAYYLSRKASEADHNDSPFDRGFPALGVGSGEQTATALEASLANLESKLDELLASFGIPPEYDEGNNLPEEDDDDDEQDENGDNKDKATVNHGKEGEATEKLNKQEIFVYQEGEASQRIISTMIMIQIANVDICTDTEILTAEWVLESSTIQNGFF